MPGAKAKSKAMLKSRKIRRVKREDTSLSNKQAVGKALGILRHRGQTR